MRAFLLIVAGLVMIGCGGHSPGDIDQTIGARCTSDRNCDSRCYLGSHFPEGFCSLVCESDNDCPSDTFCMADSGGVCMYACPQFDCTRLGLLWGCRDRSRQNGGSVTVCSGP